VGRETGRREGRRAGGKGDGQVGGRLDGDGGAVGGAGGAVWEVVARVGRAEAKCGRTRVVGVDGRSGAGKSTFAGALSVALGASVVALEQIYGGWSGLEHGVDLLVSDVLQPLAAGRTAYVPRYDWVTQTWEKPVPLEPPDVLIVEGVGTGARRAAAYESVLVWLESAESVRKQRALARDGDAFAPFWAMWAAQEDALLAVERTPERADIVIAS
jgi:uridine kinase